MISLRLTDQPKHRLALVIAYCLYTSLVCIASLQSLLAEKNIAFIWLIQVSPLLLLLPGLWQQHYRSFSWLCFLMLIYFTSYVIQTYSVTREWIDFLGLANSILLFIASMLCSRWLQRQVAHKHQF